MPSAVGIVADSYNKPASGPPFPSTALVGWFDATDNTSFTYGTGTQIASWVDKSTKGFTVSGTPNASLTRDATINGKTAVNGGMGINETRLSRSINARDFVDSVNRTDCMTFAVVEFPSTVGAGGYFEVQGTNYRVSAYMQGGAANYFDIVDAGGGRINGDIGLGTATPAIITMYRDGANMKVRVNGVDKLVKTTASGSMTADDTATFKLPGGGSGYYGKLGEFIQIARYNAADLASIESYLFTKWGITPPPPSPLTMAAWYSAFWASDPSWTPPADGGVATTWRDGSGNSRNATLTGGPIYRSASSFLNNKPAIDFDGVDDYGLTTGPSLPTQTISWAAVLRCANVTPQGYWATDGGLYGAYVEAGKWGMYSPGTNVVTGGTADTSKHFVVMTWSPTGTSTLKVDGVTVASYPAGFNSNIVDFHISIWANNSAAPGKFTFGFIGFRLGGFTGPEEANLLAWSRSFYGTP